MRLVGGTPEDRREMGDGGGCKNPELGSWGETAYENEKRRGAGDRPLGVIRKRQPHWRRKGGLVGQK